MLMVKPSEGAQAYLSLRLKSLALRSTGNGNAGAAIKAIKTTRFTKSGHLRPLTTLTLPNSLGGYTLWLLA